jgi:probable rRNA maturation factor
MVEVEVLDGHARSRGRGGADAVRPGPPGRNHAGTPTAPAPSAAEIVLLCNAAASAAGVEDGHLAVEFVDERRMAELNAVYRGHAEPTDVLSFPVDEGGPAPGARELGDVVICLEHTVDVREAIVHGVLHLVGMDHEADDGQMLALQREVLGRRSV